MVWCCVDRLVVTQRCWCGVCVDRQVEEGPLVQWVECLGVLSTALEIMQVSVRREASAEAEILLAMGQ